MRVIQTAGATYRLQGAEIVEEYCATAPCCPTAAGQCDVFPPYPDELFLTLSGFASPNVNVLAFENVNTLTDFDVALWNFASPWVTTANTGVDTAFISAMNFWKNGTYRLRRVTADEYILADSVTPFVMGSSYVTPPPTTSTIGGFRDVLSGKAIYLDHDLPGVHIETLGCAETAFNAFSGYLHQLSPADFAFDPGTWDAIIGCPTPAQSYPIWFASSVPATWAAHMNIIDPYTSGTNYPYPKFGIERDGVTNLWRRVPMSRQTRCWKQAHVKIDCVYYPPPENRYARIPDISMYSYISATVNSKADLGRLTNWTTVAAADSFPGTILFPPTADDGGDIYWSAGVYDTSSTLIGTVTIHE